MKNMKKIKKIFLIITLIVLIILLIIFCIKKTPKNSSNKIDTSRDFILNTTNTPKANTHGENSGILVGVTENEKENYMFISIKIDKDSPKENQIETLITEIGNSIGYKIDVNSIKIDEENIKIDFSKTAAPFELEESHNTNITPKYFLGNNNFVAKTVFDSINKTLKSYFGENTYVYFSVDSEDINIQTELETININTSQPY